MQNLGDIDGPQFENGELFIEYGNGDMCGSVPRRTRIFFQCGDSLGEPVFVREESCYYVFNWRTSVACAPGQPHQVDASNCQVSNEATGAYVDLRSLEGSAVSAINEVNADTFKVGVCGGVSCGGSSSAGVCMNGNVNLGNANDAPELAGGSARLVYTGGDKCGSGNRRYSAEIVFVCDDTAADSTQQLYYQDTTSDCTYVFKWYSRAACEKPHTISCAVRDYYTSDTYDLTPLVRWVLKAHGCGGRKKGEGRKGGGCWLVTVENDLFFRKLCEAMGK